MTTDNISIASYRRGAYIVVEGEKSDGRFYIIEHGSVKLTKTMSIGDVSRMTLNAGDFFEVETALTGKRRLFNAVAIEDCKLIMIPKTQFNILIKKKPSLVQKVILQFSQRMRKLDHILSSRNTFTTQEAHTESTALSLRKVGEFYQESELLENAAFAFDQYVKTYPHEADVEEVKEKLQAIIDQLGTADFLEEDTEKEETTVQFKEGDIIFLDGMRGDRMYFIQQGFVKICKVSGKYQITLATLKKGDLFGEMALLEAKPRSANAIAASDCTFIVITNQNFPALVQRDPNLITRITTVLANRIWFVYRQIANIVLPAGADRLYDAFSMFMEHQGIENTTAQTPVELNMTLKDLIHYTAMDPRQSKELLADFVKDKVIRIVNDKIIILNTQYVNNRAATIRDNFEKQKNKAKT